MKHTILIVDDEQTVRDLVGDFLQQSDFEVIKAGDGEEALNLFDRRSPELSILDVQLPGLSGLQLLEQIKARDPHHPVIIISAQNELETAVLALKSGASEYLRKPANLEALKLAVDKAFNERRLEGALTYLQAEKEQEFRQGTVIGASTPMRTIMQTVQTVAGSPASTVLITGESGTGKEVIAKAIHYFSPQRNKPFLELNCTAVPEMLMESELFGHERGAFTDAKTRKQGLLELADGGTFLLDEIGEMPLNLQAKLLRVIEDRSFRRVGGVKNYQVDLRMIAATNCDLNQKVREGHFRADLYYRLNVISVHLPPLRERGDDIYLLAHHFLDYFNRSYRRDVKGFNDEATHLLGAYPWPGNVRELRNAVERAVMISASGWVTPRDLNIERRLSPRDEETPRTSCGLLNLPEEGVALDDIEREALLFALNKCDWNVSQASRFLRISRQVLRYRMAKHGIEQEEAV